MPGLNEISPPQLMRKLGGPDAPVIVDIRIDDDRHSHPVTLPTARIIPHTGVEAIAALIGAAPAVIVCHQGRKLSHGIAALLRDRGYVAEVLEGGLLAWLDADLPRLPLVDLPLTRRWVTRHRPKIDRIACPWLIRRFINPAAEILYVPPAEVAGVADRFDATAFDTADAPFGHAGDRCTFDALIARFGLRHAALDRLADVVRAADTGDHATCPQAAGLLALSVGLSRLHKDDTAQLAAAMPLYDALYRWARDGFDEQHAWPEGHGA